jgi:hypothetical protein
MSEAISDRLPLNETDFTALRHAHRIYADKSALIAELAAPNWKICLARPRGFGKTLLHSAFASLFTSGARDFEGLALAPLWMEAGVPRRTVRLDLSLLGDFDSAESFEASFRALWGRAFAEAGFDDAQAFFPELQLTLWLQRQPSSSLVLLIDGYDAPLQRCAQNPALSAAVQGTLSEFYSALKAASSAFRFLFMTGETRFSQTSIFSDLNDVRDISEDPRFAALLGFTEEEVKHYFGDYLRASARALTLSETELLSVLKKRCGGFCFGDSGSVAVFEPRALLTFFREQKGTL